MRRYPSTTDAASSPRQSRAHLVVAQQQNTGSAVSHFGQLRRTQCEKGRTWVDGEDREHKVGDLFRFRFRELVLFHQHVSQRPELQLLDVPEFSSVFHAPHNGRVSLCALTATKRKQRHLRRTVC